MKKVSGIQRKYLKYTLVLLLLTLLMSSVAIWVYMQEKITASIIEKYEYINEKMGLSLDTLFQKSDEVLAECIYYEGVQESLKAQPLEEVERSALSKYFAYLDLENVSEYCYVDNKKNVYSRSYTKLDYDDFKNSRIEEQLGDSYASTQWFRTEDTLFGKKELEVFIGRYVRCMDYSHEPGMIFLRMESEFFTEILESTYAGYEDAAIGVMDEHGEAWKKWYPEGYELPEEDKDVIRALAKEERSGMILSQKKIKSGVLSAYRQKETGLIVFSIVPNNVLSQGMESMFIVMLGIYAFVIAIAVILSVYFSNRFTRPIKIISKAMTGFDGTDFTQTVSLNTNTELDQIGQSYNEMLVNIEELLDAIKKKERDLRNSELDTLISQINPHFLYNTLDTIYMLARMNGEETTMKMIHALSKYLRLSLSKGKDIVSVGDELENVKSYMEIQQIRNENLFKYEIECQVNEEKTYILKLILQPLVENAIKHGFCEIYEGGQIRIDVREEREGLEFRVFNSGLPMKQEIADKINALNHSDLSEVNECFPDQRRGYGIANIITRLRLKYGEDVRFEYQVEENGTTCIIWIPKN